MVLLCWYCCCYLFTFKALTMNQKKRIQITLDLNDEQERRIFYEITALRPRLRARLLVQLWRRAADNGVAYFMPSEFAPGAE